MLIARVRKRLLALRRREPPPAERAGGGMAAGLPPVLSIGPVLGPPRAGPQARGPVAPDRPWKWPRLALGCPRPMPPPPAGLPCAGEFGQDGDGSLARAGTRPASMRNKLRGLVHLGLLVPRHSMRVLHSLSHSPAYLDVPQGHVQYRALYAPSISDIQCPTPIPACPL